MILGIVLILIFGLALISVVLTTESGAPGDVMSPPIGTSDPDADTDPGEGEAATTLSILVALASLLGGLGSLLSGIIDLTRLRREVQKPSQPESDGPTPGYL